MGGIEGEAAFCSWSTGRPAEPRRAGDGCQRPLVPRSRCLPRLPRGVIRHVNGECRTFPVNRGRQGHDASTDGQRAHRG